MQISIAQYLPSDQKQIKKLILTELERFGFYYNPQYDYDLDDPQKYYIDSGGMFYVLKKNDKVIGTIAVINKGNAVAQLKRLYVDTSYQGRGYGSKLLDKAIEFCRSHGFRKIEFETNKKFTKAHGFYKKRGFKVVNEDERSFYMEKLLV